VIRLAVRVAREHAELMLAQLLELAPAGVEEVDVDERHLEYVIYGAPGELPQLPALQAAAGSALVHVSTTEIADDWPERWRAFHRPLTLGTKLTVRPPWEPPGTTEIDIVIDPGRAFGTGAHATTRLCLELLLRLSPAVGAGRTVLDLGCGSGVLAIAAAKLGWGPVLALDTDPLAVQATAENAAVNDVEVTVRRADLFDIEPPAGALVLANLLGPLLTRWASRLCADRCRPPETVIASGMLTDETDGVAAGFGELGLTVQRRAQRGEWAALLLERLPR